MLGDTRNYILIGVLGFRVLIRGAAEGRSCAGALSHICHQDTLELGSYRLFSSTICLHLRRLILGRARCPVGRGPRRWPGHCSEAGRPAQARHRYRVRGAAESTHTIKAGKTGPAGWVARLLGLSEVRLSNARSGKSAALAAGMVLGEGVEGPGLRA
jgi:hypothetical protein